MNPNNPGKVRSVLIRASKFHGTSLKKSLLVGPDLRQNIVFVLLPFCQHHVAVSSDFEVMFCQVGVFSEGQPSHRFLLREGLTADVVVIFGARASPNCANCLLQRNAMDNQAVFSDAASARIFFMDDYLAIFEDPDVTFKLSPDFFTLFALGG